MAEGIGFGFQGFRASGSEADWLKNSVTSGSADCQGEGQPPNYWGLHDVDSCFFQGLLSYKQDPYCNRNRVY